MTRQWVVLVPGPDGAVLKYQSTNSSDARKAAEALVIDGSKFAYVGQIEYTLSASFESDEPMVAQP